jgi:hypothetical protein
MNNLIHARQTDEGNGVDQGSPYTTNQSLNPGSAATAEQPQATSLTMLLSEREISPVGKRLMLVKQRDGPAAT